jgi:hypothetical protein
MPLSLPARGGAPRELASPLDELLRRAAEQAEDQAVRGWLLALLERGNAWDFASQGSSKEHERCVDRYLGLLRGQPK